MMCRLCASIVALASVTACDGAGSDAPELPLSEACADPLAFALPDGSCMRPGIAPDGCAPGFEHDGGYGCNAILPESPCPPGLMAIPGETQCRPVMSCAEGRWGDIVVDATTQYVDAAHTGAPSNGSAAQPWVTIADAVAAAGPGELIAIARGTYLENVVVSGKPVRLWGVCPDEVEIVGSGESADLCPPAALCIHSGAHGSEVRGVALRGSGLGLAVSAAEQVLVDAIWAHDAALYGIDVNSALGAASVTIQGSLVERNHGTGISVVATNVHLEGSVVRDTLPNGTDQSNGRGIGIQTTCVDTPLADTCDASQRADVTIGRSLIERNHEVGVIALGSNVHVEASVVAGTLPNADQVFGRGMALEGWCDATSSAFRCDPTLRASATIIGSLFEHNHEGGVSVAGSDADLQSSVVRDTLPRAADQEFGRGVSIEVPCTGTPAGLSCDAAARGHAVVRSSLIERNHDTEIFVAGSDASVDATVVRATLPQASDQRLGRGIVIQPLCPVEGREAACDPATRASMEIVGSLVADSHDIGLLVVGSDVNVSASAVRSTAPRAADGLLGDGVAAVATTAAAAFLSLERTSIDDSARSGLASFGAHVSLKSIRVRCAAFSLSGASHNGRNFFIEDRGDNRCGCGGDDGACKTVTPGLDPPLPAPSGE